jgi:transposase
MRGDDLRQDPLFSYVSVEERVPAAHPLRKLRVVVNAILASMSEQFAPLYSDVGRPSIPPEKLFRALLLQILYTVRSERQLMEQMDYNLLFRWFVGLSMDDKVWDASTFSANRERLLNQAMAREFFSRVLALAQWKGLTSDEHFSVDGTLIQAWASHKSFRRKDGSDEPPKSGGRNAEADFKGEKRSNATHASRTDPDAKLYRKSDAAPAVLGYLAHGLMENRSGLIVDVETTPATGTAERDAAITMLARTARKAGATVGGDKGYDTRDFVVRTRAHGVRPHVAQNTTNRRSAIDARTTRHAGYAVSLRKRKQIEEAFGWIKTIGGMRKTRFVGQARVAAQSLFTFAAYNLVRLGSLLGWRRAAPA